MCGVWCACCCIVREREGAEREKEREWMGEANEKQIKTLKLKYFVPASRMFNYHRNINLKSYRDNSNSVISSKFCYRWKFLLRYIQFVRNRKKIGINKASEFHFIDRLYLKLHCFQCCKQGLRFRFEEMFRFQFPFVDGSKQEQTGQWKMFREQCTRRRWSVIVPGGVRSIAGMRPGEFISRTLLPHGETFPYSTF